MFVMVLYLARRLHKLCPWYKKDIVIRNFCSVLQPFEKSYSLIVLNSEANSSEVCRNIKRFWENANFRVLADGGGNALYELHKQQHVKALPDAIVGDLDSVTKETLQYFEKLGVSVVQTTDQNTTDFTKAIRYMTKFKPLGDHILVLATRKGRLDHMFGILNTLYIAKNMHIYVLFGTSIISLILPGSHEISCPVGSTCGIVPLNKPVNKIKTQGLQWDLDNARLEFGEMVSTSNCILHSPVLIDTSDPVLWMIEVDL